MRRPIYHDCAVTKTRANLVKNEISTLWNPSGKFLTGSVQILRYHSSPRFRWNWGEYRRPGHVRHEANCCVNTDWNCPQSTPTPFRRAPL